MRAAWRFVGRTVEGGNWGVMVAGVGGMVLRSLVRTGMQLPHWDGLRVVVGDRRSLVPCPEKYNGAGHYWTET